MERMVAKRLKVSDASKAAFAQRLRSVIDERGLTVAETARRMRTHLPKGESISVVGVLHYLSGRSLPRLRYLDALSLALNVDNSELVPDLVLVFDEDRLGVPDLVLVFDEDRLGISRN
jgi:transcriptional regulator with XRE-family HTH domain